MLNEITKLLHHCKLVSPFSMETFAVIGECRRWSLFYDSPCDLSVEDSRYRVRSNKCLWVRPHAQKKCVE
jgi:hypothetical protein